MVRDGVATGSGQWDYIHALSFSLVLFKKDGYDADISGMVRRCEVPAGLYPYVGVLSGDPRVLGGDHGFGVAHRPLIGIGSRGAHFSLQWRVGHDIFCICAVDVVHWECSAKGCSYARVSHGLANVGEVLGSSIDRKCVTIVVRAGYGLVFFL
jgi:hypothetical protein